MKKHKTKHYLVLTGLTILFTLVGMLLLSPLFSRFGFINNQDLLASGFIGMIIGVNIGLRIINVK